VREADSPEKTAAAVAELDELATTEVETPAATVPGTLEALAESQPALVAALRESAKAEVATELVDTQTQLREAQKLNGETATVLETLSVLKECEVTNLEDVQWYVGEVQLRGLRESDQIKAFVRGQLDRDKRVREGVMEALTGAGVEGVPGSRPGSSAANDGGLAKLREAGIPTREPAAA
jgi:hypothetical protein